MATDSRLIICLLLCFVGFVNSSTVLCETGFCRDYIFKTGCASPQPHCGINNATHSGMWLPSPTICNCCPYCLPFIVEDDHCSLGGPGTGVTVGRCGEGLTCTNATDGNNYCRRMTSECHAAQAAFDARHDRGEVGSMEFRPHCDAKGNYAPFDCVPAHTCFCQSEKGKRLFGEVLYLGSTTTENMHCGCSRLHRKIMETIQPGLRHPVVPPRCTPDGNFYPIQCVNRVCYCVDRITGHIVDADVQGNRVDLNTHPLTSLNCYDPELDMFPHLSEGEPPFNFTTPCLEEQQEKVKFIQQSDEDGYITDYFNSYIECMPDGTYGHVMFARNRTKFCADEAGRQIENYSAALNTDDYESMDCKCAYTAHVMASSREKPVCCKNGNFRPIQCHRGFCRCVDSDGRQKGPESTDVTRLSCYTDNWRKC